ncbi:hypothetical protein AB2B41_01170 [Marimonas sp. MJW-29]|uniref:DUF4034 domain-containing protein n=1 Tax=Sulfitobacter sediminis TaxID=3234186 RepID=A0ABV3RGW6_9RHOB
MRLISTVLALGLTFATPALSFSIDDLHAAVADEDFALLEQGLDTAQSEYLDGDRSADDIRALYIALSRSAPKMADFVKSWFESDRSNPQAQIARAWSLYNGSLQIALADNEYSREVVRSMQVDMNELIRAAWKTAPDLVPVEDAMIRGHGLHIDSQTPLEVMDLALERDPNWGSILRALHELHVTSAEVQKNFCMSVAEDFPPVDFGLIRHRCLMTLALWYGHPEMLDYAYKHLWDESDPELTVTRVAHFVTWTNFTGWTPEQIDWAERILLTHPVDQFELVYLAQIADTFQHKVRHAHGRHLGGNNSVHFVDVFRQERLAVAEDYLEKDPLNIGLIDLVDGVAHAQEMEMFLGKDGNVTYRPVATDLSADEKRARNKAAADQRHFLNLQRLTASPYHAEYWREYANSVARRNLPHSLFDGQAARQNAVIFSNDPLAQLEGLIGEIESNFRMIEQVEAMPKDELDRIPNWKSFYRNTDISQKVLCPYLRARALKKHLCESYPASDTRCRESVLGPAERQQRLLDRANGAPDCQGILSASPEELWYDLTDFSTATNQSRQ